MTHSMSRRSFAFGILVMLASLVLTSVAKKHICNKLLNGNFTNLQLQSFTYLRQKSDPSKFDLYLIESGQAYETSFSSDRSGYLKLNIAPTFTPWTTKFNVNTTFSAISNADLVSVYALQGSKWPEYHLAITTKLNESLINPVTGKLLPFGKNNSRAHPDFTLALDPRNEGFALSSDIYGGFKDYAMYQFQYVIKSEKKYSRLSSAIHKINASDVTKKQATYFYLERSKNPKEVHILPHNLRTSFGPARVLLKSLPIGFMTYLPEIDQQLFLFDAASGCVYVIYGLNSSAMITHKKVTAQMSVFPFERILDCSTIASHSKLFTKADARCGAIWDMKILNLSYTPVFKGSKTSNGKTSSKELAHMDAEQLVTEHRHLMFQISMYAWIVMVIFGAIFLLSFVLALAVINCHQKRLLKKRLIHSVARLASKGSSGLPKKEVKSAEKVKTSKVMAPKSKAKKVKTSKKKDKKPRSKSQRNDAVELAVEFNKAEATG